MFAFVQSLAIKLTTFVKGAKFSNYLVLVAVLSSATSPIVVVVGHRLCGSGNQHFQIKIAYPHNCSYNISICPRTNSLPVVQTIFCPRIWVFESLARVGCSLAIATLELEGSTVALLEVKHHYACHIFCSIRLRQVCRQMTYVVTICANDKLFLLWMKIELFHIRCFYCTYLI